MHKINTILFFILVILITGCHNAAEPDHTAANDQSFLSYLEKTFNEYSTIKEQMFITIPCVGCAGCEQFIYTTFTEQLINHKKFTLIICNPEKKGLLSPSLHADNVKYDFQGKMNDFEFGYGYPSCFVVKDNRVVHTFTLSSDIIYWMNEFQWAQKMQQPEKSE